MPPLRLPGRTDALLITLQAVLALGLVAAFALTGRAPVQTPWHGIGAAALAGVASAIGVWALYTMRHSLRIAPTPRDDAVLIQHGIYARLRHPMYTAVVLLVAAITLYRPSTSVVAVAAVNLTYYLAKARYEEGLLAARYPDYGLYRSRTWGVLPGF